MFFQSGGCCDGSSPMCFTSGELLLGPNDLLLGAVDGCSFHIDADQYERWNSPALVLDVAAGSGSSMSLEELHGVHFVLAPSPARIPLEKGSPMKALVYHGPGERAWESVPDPSIIDPTDAIVRIDSSTICGTDLHILKGDVPEVKPGTILGHEAVGTVVEIGAAVTTVAVGDRVLVSCISACGRCRFCKEGHYGLCTGGGGWIFGHLIDGLQAEYARVPFADTSVYKVPDGPE